jgi:hypothetical protein
MLRRSDALKIGKTCQEVVLVEGKKATQPASPHAASYLPILYFQKFSNDTATEQKIRGQAVVLYKKSLIVRL